MAIITTVPDPIIIPEIRTGRPKPEGEGADYRYPCHILIRDNGEGGEVGSPAPLAAEWQDGVYYWELTQEEFNNVSSHVWGFKVPDPKSGSITLYFRDDWLERVHSLDFRQDIEEHLAWAVLEIVPHVSRAPVDSRAQLVLERDLFVRELRHSYLLGFGRGIFLNQSNLDRSETIARYISTLYWTEDSAPTPSLATNIEVPSTEFIDTRGLSAATRTETARAKRLALMNRALVVVNTYAGSDDTTGHWESDHALTDSGEAAIKALVENADSSRLEVYTPDPIDDLAIRWHSDPVEPTMRDINLRWSDPYDGGSAITSIEVDYRLLDGVYGSHVVTLAAGTQSYQGYTDIPTGNYAFRIRALNVHGASPWHEVLVAIT